MASAEGTPTEVESDLWASKQLVPKDHFRDLLKDSAHFEFRHSNSAKLAVALSGAFGFFSAATASNASLDRIWNDPYNTIDILNETVSHSTQYFRDTVEFASGWGTQLLGVQLAAFAIFAALVSTDLAARLARGVDKTHNRSLASSVAISFVGASIPMLLVMIIQLCGKLLIPRGGMISQLLWRADPLLLRILASTASALVSSVLGWMVVALKDLIMNVYRVFLWGTLKKLRDDIENRTR